MRWVYAGTTGLAMTAMVLTPVIAYQVYGEILTKWRARRLVAAARRPEQRLGPGRRRPADRQLPQGINI